MVQHKAATVKLMCYVQGHVVTKQYIFSSQEMNTAKNKYTHSTLYYRAAMYFCACFKKFLEVALITGIHDVLSSILRILPFQSV